MPFRSLLPNGTFRLRRKELDLGACKIFPRCHQYSSSSEAESGGAILHAFCQFWRFLPSTAVSMRAVPREASKLDGTDHAGYFGASLKCLRCIVSELWRLKSRNSELAMGTASSPSSIAPQQDKVRSPKFAETFPRTVQSWWTSKTASKSMQNSHSFSLPLVQVFREKAVGYSGGITGVDLEKGR